MLFVLDTNVFVSNCLGKGPSNAVVKSCLLGENTAFMLAEFDAETRFQLRAERGQGEEVRGLELLAKVMDDQ